MGRTESARVLLQRIKNITEKKGRLQERKIVHRPDLYDSDKSRAVTHLFIATTSTLKRSPLVAIFHLENDTGVQLPSEGDQHGMQTTGVLWGRVDNSASGFTWRLKKENSIKIGMVAQASNRLTNIWKSTTLHTKTKLKIHRPNVQVLLMYTSETRRTKRRYKADSEVLKNGALGRILIIRCELRMINRPRRWGEARTVPMAWPCSLHGQE